MNASNCNFLKALFGGKLNGGAPVYYIYVDEAGTSAKEPVTVVVGVIIHADTQWRIAQEHLEKVLDDFVPPDLRQGFIFHAKNIWSGYREHDDTWSKNERSALIEAVASIPLRLGMAISLGRVKRGKLPCNFKQIKPCEFDHIFAFQACMARANKYVRDWGNATEVATVVAEDVTHMRRFLRAVLKVNPPDLPITEQYLNPTRDEIASGVMTQTNPGPIDRIIDTVHFVDKKDAPLPQIADACAFSFRRYFAGQDNGEVFVRSMLGSDLVWEDWQGPSSNYCFDFNPEHRRV
jgi:hypothetical protein